MQGYEPGSAGLLAPLNQWLSAPNVSEILINHPKEVWVENELGMNRHAAPEMTEAHLYRLFQLIANENKELLSPEHPLLSGHLKEGVRVQLCLPPTSRYPTLSIRRQVKKSMSLQEYQAAGCYDKTVSAKAEADSFSSLPLSDQKLVQLYAQKAWPEFVEHAILFKKNIVISGGTSSGKTTYLNACLRHIDRGERLIILEDTREVDAPHPNQVQLWAPKGGQSLAKLSMQDLVQCSLRLRPDRIIMGEIRGAEILDFVSACSTGHEGSMTTLHANSPHIAFMRMTQLYKLNGVPSMSDEDILRELKTVIDIIIQLTKTPAGRKVHSIYYKYGHMSCSNLQ